jgi:hypothetical protein
MDFKQYKSVFIVLATLIVFVLPVNATITSITAEITPTQAYKTSTLDCGFTVEGNLSNYRVNVTWLKNDAAYTTDNENNILTIDNELTHTSLIGDIENSDLTKGQSWKCIATAYDIEDDTMTITSVAVTILNSAPIITSSAKTTARTREAYSYSVVATDADSDLLTYTLITSPANMTISSSGVISWNPDETDAGNHNIVIGVADSSTVTAQSYTLAVSKEKMILNYINARCSPSCSDDTDAKTGGSINNVRPGSTLKLEMRVENIWPSNTDNHNIENIDIEGILESMGDEDDQDKTVSPDDIEPGERSKLVTLQYTIPNEIDEDTYNLELTITGEDEDNTDYTITLDIDIDVEKENHLLLIKKAEVMPTTISCMRNIKINTMVKNIGANDEDKAQLTLINSDLGLSTYFIFDVAEGDYDDSDTEWSKSYDFKVADSVLPGNYDIDVKAYYENSRDYESTTIPLIVRACTPNSGSTTTGTTGTTGSNTEAENTQETEKVEVITTPAQSTQVKIPVTAKPISTSYAQTSNSFMESDTFLILLVGGIILLLIVCGFLIYALAKK